MAIAPADKPKYLFVTLYDEPQGLPETFGFATAAWNAGATTGKIIERVAPLLGPAAALRAATVAVPGHGPPGRMGHAMRLARSSSRIFAGSSRRRTPDPGVTGVTADSRAVAPGCVFFAVPGTQGRRPGLRRAARRGGRGRGGGGGARVPRDLPTAPPIVRVPDVRRALALAAAARCIRGQPGDHRRRHRHQRQDLGRRVHPPDPRGVRPAGGEPRHHRRRRAVGRRLRLADDARPGDAARDARPTSPREGVTHLAMEASSHGLDQRRLDGVRLTAARLHQSRPRPPRLPSRRSRTISRPSCGCSTRCCPTERHGGGQRRRRARRRRSSTAAQARGLRTMTVGRAGKHLRLASLARDGFGQAHDRGGATAAASTCTCRWPATSRPPTRWSPRGSRSPAGEDDVARAGRRCPS